MSQLCVENKMLLYSSFEQSHVCVNVCYWIFDFASNNVLIMFTKGYATVNNFLPNEGPIANQKSLISYSILNNSEIMVYEQDVNVFI